MQANIASLFDKDLSEVPDFMHQENNNNEDKTAWTYTSEYLDTLGYEITDWIHCENILKEGNTYALKSIINYFPSINGHYYATVRSAKYFEEYGSYHAVILDSNGDLAHDPNPNYNFDSYYPIVRLVIIEKKED